MRLFIIDPTCPTPYTVRTLSERTLGGTEATCIRLCRELAKRDKVYLMQRNRTEYLEEDGITYLPGEKEPENPDVVITLRDGQVYNIAKRRHPNAIHYLWMHDVVGGQYQEYLEQNLTGVPTHFIVGSAWQFAQLHQGFGDKFDTTNWKVKYVTNFVENYCDRDFTPHDPYKLIFFSSPHKGLDNVLSIFEKLRSKDNRYVLYLANPGYFASRTDVPEGVVNVGILTHKELMQHVKTALCTFYPNTSFPETFGLVYAESNAMGTPVIAHNIGAAAEVVTTPEQILDCDNHDQVIETVLRWSAGERPIVKVKEQYTIREAIRDWRKMLNPMRVIK